jgi:hypothetical protein
MSSKILAVVLLAVGCVVAAGTGAYLALRQSAGEPVAAASVSPSDSSAAAAPQPTAVVETETVLPTPSAQADTSPSAGPRESVRLERNKPVERATARKPAPRAAKAPRAAPTVVSESRDSSDRPPPEPAALPESAPLESAPAPEVPVREAEPLPPLVLYEDVIVPAASVIGLRVETALTSERAEVEDRVEARVTRDVTAEGRVAVPAGARAIGSVTLVERGGKMKDRARLGVRFHTLVLADGRQVPISTEAIFREGDSPSGESARKIGGAAAGGAILGALLGGKKGAVVGGAAGAGAGTAAVMAGGRNAATLAAGTVLTVRLAAPVAIEVEKR